jgi:hypothetical protein
VAAARAPQTACRRAGSGWADNNLGVLPRGRRFDPPRALHRGPSQGGPRRLRLPVIRLHDLHGWAILALQADASKVVQESAWAQQHQHHAGHVLPRHGRLMTRPSGSSPVCSPLPIHLESPAKNPQRWRCLGNFQVSEGGLEHRRPPYRPVLPSATKRRLTRSLTHIQPSQSRPVQLGANASVSKRLAEGRTEQDQLASAR